MLHPFSLKLNKIAFYIFAIVSVPMNICFSAFWSTCLVLYKSLLDPFVYNFREFWRERQEYGIIGLLIEILEAFSWVIGRVIISPFVLFYLLFNICYSSIVSLKHIGNWIASNEPSINAVSTFKPLKDKQGSVTAISFWLPPQTDDSEHIESFFFAILGYIFGIYRFNIDVIKPDQKSKQEEKKREIDYMVTSNYSRPSDDTNHVINRSEIPYFEEDLR